MDIRIELVSVPVTDIDRAIAFYTEQVGFTLDHDLRVGEEIRFVQITPPGSACSILVGSLSEMAPGSQRGLQCVNLANGMTSIHTPDEHIAVDDLEAMVDVTLALVDTAAGR